MADPATTSDGEIRSQSKTLSALFLAAAIAVGFVLIGGVGWPIVGAIGGAFEGEPWRGAANAVGLKLIAALPSVLLLFGVLAAQRVFARMGEGQIFTAANAADIRRIGENMVWAAIAAILISPTLAAWVRHERSVTIDVQDWALILGVLGAAIGLMGRVLGLANQIKAENEEIV